MQRLVAAGGSQSAMRLATYLNAVHPSERVFDAFLLSVWEARAPRPEEGVLPMGVRTALRTDVPTPVVVVNSEFESTHLAQVPCVDTDWVRVWEVAGTPHGNARRRLDEPDRRGRVANRLRWAPVHDAALRALQHWLVDGVPAPRQPRIEMDLGPPLRIAVDDAGNARRRHPPPRARGADRHLPGRRHGHRTPPALRCRHAVHRRRGASRATPAAPTTRPGGATAVDALVASGALRPEDAPTMRARVAEVKLPF